MPVSKSPYYALAVLAAINVANFYDRQVLGAVSEEIRHEWPLSDSDIGWLNTAFTLLYAAVGVPLGRWTDRGPRVKTLAVGVTVWSVLTALSGACQNFTQLFLVRLGVGVGEATCAPAASSLIGDLFPAERRGRAISLFMIGLPVGLALSFLISGLVVGPWGWRAAFLVAGVPGLLCAVAALGMAEPPRGAADRVAPQAQPLSLGQALGRLTRIPTFGWLLVSGAIYNFCIYAIGAFLVAYLKRFHGLDAWHANLTSMFAFGLSGVPGLLVGGFLADRVTRRSSGRLHLGAAAMLLAAGPWYLALQQPAGQLGAFGACAALGCGLMYFYYSSVYPTLQDIIEPSLRGTATAIYFFAMYVMGASFGPLLVGRLSDHYTRTAALAAGTPGVAALATSNAVFEPFRAVGLRSAMVIIPVLLAALAVVLVAAARTVSRDTQATRARMGRA
jgi:MFS family permease